MNKHIIRRIGLGLAASAVVAAPIVVTESANANPGSPGCVTLAEHMRMTKGMTRNQVHNVTGAWGRVTAHQYYWDTDSSWSIVKYPKCHAAGNLIVGYASFKKINGHWVQWNVERLDDKDRWW